jgi:hypothetical protein
MADPQNGSLKPLLVANYNSAIARAVEWLGDRYLLARPINAARSRRIDGGTHVNPFAAMADQSERRASVDS